MEMKCPCYKIGPETSTMIHNFKFHTAISMVNIPM